MLVSSLAWAAPPPQGRAGSDPALPIAPTAAGLLRAGACRGEGRIDGVEPRAVPGGRILWELRCSYAAYQGAYEYWWSDAQGLRPALATGASPWTLVGNPTVNPADGLLTWLDKARGPGDCGEWWRLRLVGDRFEILDHRARECPDALVEPTPPETWPTVTAELCEPGDEALFRCDTSGGKVLALCGSASRLQYRFGKVGAPELVYPADGGRTAFTATPTELTFWNGGYRYDVGAMPAGVGVQVSKGTAVVASIACRSAEPPDWVDLVR